MSSHAEEVVNRVKEKVVSDADRLCMAAQKNDLKKFKEILAKGVPLNAVSHNGFHAIHYAASHGSIMVLRHIIKLMQESNATEIIRAQTPKGKLALDLAQKSNHQECIALLKDMGTIVAKQLLQKRAESLKNLPPIVPKTYHNNAEREAAFEAEKADVAEAADEMREIFALSGKKLGTVTFNGVDVSKPTPKNSISATAVSENSKQDSKADKKSSRNSV